MCRNSTRFHRLVVTALALASTLGLASCAPAPVLERAESVFATWCSIRIVDGGDAQALDAAFDKLHDYDRLLSSYLPDSEISAVNRAAGGAAVPVSAETFDALRSALDFARLTDGVVDPTVEPLVTLWGIGTDKARVPSQAEIDAALRLVNWKDLVLDESARSARLAKSGMAIDLGAFAKGWAADRIKLLLAERGTKAAIIDLGGNIFVFGKKQDGKPWKVGIQDPTKARGSYLGIASSYGESITTAGVYERFFEQDGVRYHHILDLSTGRPARSGLLAVTVIAGTSTVADGIDTALLILGREKGLALAASIPGLRVIMADDQGRVWFSPGTNRVFELTSPDWKLAE
jgi:thiamine biosynthesis lipoprotein